MTQTLTQKTLPTLNIAAAGIACMLCACRVFNTAPVDAGVAPGPGTDTLPQVPRLSPLVIEEIVPGNVDWLDERGEDPGWVELSNLADTAIALGAWQLRDEDGDGKAWRLPDTSLPPGGRIVVFCSGLDRRQIRPAGDTVSAFGSEGYAWSDSMNNPPGRSSFGPNEIAGGLFGTLMPEKLPAWSATLNLRDPNGSALDWSAVEMNMRVPGGALNLGDRDRLRLRATLAKGQAVLLRFCETGQQCWQGETVRVEGTGNRLDTYDLPLMGLHTDFTRLAEIAVVPPGSRFDTYRFTLTELRFYRAARWPHASFELHRKGGTLHLEERGGTWKQTVTYPEMPATASWARRPPSRDYVQRERPTPAAENPLTPPVAVLPAPVFLTPTGFHDQPVRVQLGKISGGIVRCVTKGGQPVPGTPSAEEGVWVDTTTALTCAAFDVAGRPGPTVSGLFLVKEKPSLPYLSIVVDSVAMFDSVVGLYMPGPKASRAQPNYGANFWEDTELPAHVEFFEPDGKKAFAAQAGIGIFGNWSRAKAKRPLSVQFREKYGVRRIDWPLFPQHPEFTRFKGFGLRNMGGDYASGLSRDALGTLLTDGRDLEYQLSRHVAVYINGKYWGVYDMREKLDADYLDTRFGLKSDAVDLIKNGGEVQAGTAAGWNDMIDWFMQASLTDSASLAQAATRLDLDNMATYLATEIWASNTDWPANNTRGWRRLAPATPWRMMLFDLDGGLAGFSGEQDMFKHLGDSTVVDDYPNGPKSTVFFRRLSANPAWRARFIHRLCVLLATNFAPARAIAALDSMQAAHAVEKERDMYRWRLGRAAQTTAYARVRSFLERRPADVLKQAAAYYGLGDTATITLSAEGGKLALEGYDLGAAYAGVHFEGVPMRIKAQAAGKTFLGWSDGVMTTERVIVPGAEGVHLVARFR